MVFQEICPPALIYLIFSTTQVIIDTIKGFYNMAMIKLIVTLVITILLNYLCGLGLGVISWIIVFIPFILMTLIVSMLLLMLGLDPTTGKLQMHDPNNKSQSASRSASQSASHSLVSSIKSDISDIRGDIKKDINYITGSSSPTPQGVYVDTAKNGKGVIQASTAADTLKTMEIKRKIKIVVDTTYNVSKNSKLSQYILTTLDQCSVLSSQQCSNIWMSEVLPVMKNMLGAKQTEQVLKALINKFTSEGYSANDTIGDILVETTKSSETPSKQQLKVLNDMTYSKAGTSSITSKQQNGANN